MDEKNGLNYQSVLESVNNIDVSEYPSPDVFVQIGQSAQSLIDEIVSETGIDSALDELAFSMGPTPRSDLRSVTRSQIPYPEYGYDAEPNYIETPNIEIWPEIDSVSETEFLPELQTGPEPEPLPELGIAPVSEALSEIDTVPDPQPVPESIFEEDSNGQIGFDFATADIEEHYPEPQVVEEILSEPPFSFDYMQTPKDQDYYQSAFKRPVYAEIPKEETETPEKGIRGFRRERFSFRSIKFIVFLIILFLVEMLMLGFLINIGIIHF